MPNRFDYIVVGAGSAGAIIAQRLSEDPNVKVLVLEAGPSDRHPLVQIPAGVISLLNNPKFNWKFYTEPQSELNGRSIYWAQGKVIGGSSSINGMTYTRGHSDDYNRWAEMGNRGWSWQDVLPFFKALENSDKGNSELHGTDGPIRVEESPLKDSASAAFINAAINSGISYTHDFNDGSPQGVGYASVNTAGGQRYSTGYGYLKQARSQKNLKILTHAHAVRLKFEGKRAVGIEYHHAGKIKTAFANSEIVVCGGAIKSPQLLMLSGIGDPKKLADKGIDVVEELPGVGQNLQDHFFVHFMAECSKELSMNRELSGLRAAGHLAKWLAVRKGLLNLTAAPVTGFSSPLSGSLTPDVQFFFRPISGEVNGDGKFTIHPWPGLYASFCVLHPESRGEISLKTADFETPPLIDPKYLSSQKDQETAVAGVKFLRNIFKKSPLREKIRSEYMPGPDYTTDDEILEYVRQSGETMFHPVGSCKMGNDPLAVVDDQLRVHGIQGLRVADCSIMPTIVSGTTNAAAMMIGEKAADILRNAARN